MLKLLIALETNIMGRPNEPVMPEPLAYFLTWATYGTWLPGDGRGWIKHGYGFMLPNPVLEMEAQARMSEDACILDIEQRAVVHLTIAEHCRIRAWNLYAINCRSNHLHIVVAADLKPEEIMRQFKAWSTRKLKELESERQSKVAISLSKAPRLRFGLVSSKPIRKRWWAERGSKRYLNDESSLDDAIQYVLDGQDKPL